MEVGVEAARWVVGKALGPVSGGVLEAWAASSELGQNIRELRMELLYAKGMLNNARDRGRGQEIQNPALAELLQELRDLGYRADDVLDEVDYFRIQDELDGTYHAADEHEVIPNTVGKLLPCSNSNIASSDSNSVTPVQNDSNSNIASSDSNSVTPVQNDSNSNIASRERRPFLCCPRPSKAPKREHVVQTPKLKFNRVEISQTMKEIVEQLKPVCAKVSTILNLELLDSHRSVSRWIATSLDGRLSNKQLHIPIHKNIMSRPKTNPEFIEPEFYGRKDKTSKIIHDITKGQYCDKALTVLPIVGPGGIGKTTLTQYIYNDVELQNHFEVKLWLCVSVDFNMSTVTQEIANKLPKGGQDSPDKLVEKGLKSKRFLLVLDDVWNCSDEDQWKRFLVPFTKAQTKGSVILVTTRFPAVARIVKTVDHHIDLEGLDPEAFKQLFFACIFGDKQTQNDHRGLLGIGDEILKKLKGSPLAAKTVGRLLSSNLDLDHWIRVLESREWESQKGDHDIMPALKLSFDYLPYHLQQCFTYCGLFPEDYKFGSEELIHLWIGFDVLHSYGENKSVETTGERYLKELVDHGFFKREQADDGGRTYYVIHDLLHELAHKISEGECLSISSSNVRSIQIPLSLRHLSINIDESSVKDRKAFDICREDLTSALGERLKVENLHSLLIFGRHQRSFVKTFHGPFSKAKALRVIFLSADDYSPEDLLHNFSKLVHLRYLRMGVCSKDISRFYHLRVLHLSCDGHYDLPKDMRNLVKLRHFLVEDDEIHSSICEVGKLKSLQELRRFEVKKESEGFELSQIGHLLDLGGSLCISSLEKVAAREEVDEAKLMQKNHLRELTLEWDIDRSNKDPAREEQVLEGLKPASRLSGLYITGHGGTCPSWLGANLSVEFLECLRLDSVAWKIFPPIGELWLVNEHGEEYLSIIPDQNFQNLRTIELVNLTGIKKWIVPFQSLSHLKEIIIRECTELVEVSFSHSTCSRREQKDWFPELQELVIHDCPKLSFLPPVPWTRAPCRTEIRSVCLGFEDLVYEKDDESTLSLEIRGKNAPDGAFWLALDFHNLTELRKIRMERCPPLPLDRLQMLPSLKTLEIFDQNPGSWSMEHESNSRYKFPIESVRFWGLGSSGKELSQVLSCMPNLSELEISRCEEITGIVMLDKQKEKTTSLYDDEVEVEMARQQSSREDETITALAVEDDGLLLLPPQLQDLDILNCPKLRGSGGGALQGLRSLSSLSISGCPGFLSSCFPLPSSLQILGLEDVEGMGTLSPLSNLASLSSLTIERCRDLRGGEGFWRLLALGCLTELSVLETPNFFLGSSSEASPQLHEEHGGPSSLSFKLQSLTTDDAGGLLVGPTCSLLSSSLTKLHFYTSISNFNKMERFTNEQEEALRLLTSLQELEVWHFRKLQRLPAALHSLLNLKRLDIRDCPAILSLPKDGLPSSLLRLQIHECTGIQRLPEDGLPNSLQELYIGHCPGIRTLPRVGLPSSLRLLNVSYKTNEELRKQCRKLIGTIPVVKI